jgi:prepilin-type N-terminal cleavage/methylation domain-containing protein
MKLQNVKSKIKGLTSKKGMSLPELITVIVLIAVIASGAIGYVMKAIEESRTSVATANCTEMANFLNQCSAMGVPTGFPGPVSNAPLSQALVASWAAGLQVPNTAITLHFGVPASFNWDHNYVTGAGPYTVSNPTNLP